MITTVKPIAQTLAEQNAAETPTLTAAQLAVLEEVLAVGDAVEFFVSSAVDNQVKYTGILVDHQSQKAQLIEGGELDYRVWVRRAVEGFLPSAAQGADLATLAKQFGDIAWQVVHLLPAIPSPADEQHAAVLQALLAVIGSLTARVDAALALQTIILGPILAKLPQAEFDGAHHFIDLLTKAAAKSLALSLPIRADELRPQPTPPAPPAAPAPNGDAA